MVAFVLVSCFHQKVWVKPAQLQWWALLFVLYRPLTVHPTFSSRAAAGEKEAPAAVQDLTGTEKKKKTWPEAGRLEYTTSKVGSCAAVCDKVQLSVNTLWGSLHSWRL